MTTNSATAEDRLAQLGIQLPEAPTPFGAYVPAVQTRNLLFLSGMLATSESKMRSGSCGPKPAPESYTVTLTSPRGLLSCDPIPNSRTGQSTLLIDSVLLRMRLSSTLQLDSISQKWRDIALKFHPQHHAIFR
jgi:hypothetical protein